ncbi:MAG: glycosyltransferase family 39 protein, partial [Bacteroidota bacterium]
MDNQAQKITNLDKALFGALLFFAAWLLFSNISSPPIRIWDEAIYVNNAIEMSRGGDLLVLKNDGANSLYNVKPPLVIWLQSLSIQVFGISEFAVRLPSAIAAIVVLLALFWFSTKILNKPILGILAGFTLLLSAGYFRFHVVRTGDLDSVLVAFISFYTLRFLAFLIQDQNKDPKRAIIWTSVFVTLAFFSKSFAALLPLPGLLLAALFSDKRKLILSSKYLYLSILGAFASVGLYYLVREILAPGYFEVVYQSEIKRLFSNIMPYHNHPFGYYFNNWFDNWLGRPFFLPFIYLTFL